MGLVLRIPTSDQRTQFSSTEGELVSATQQRKEELITNVQFDLLWDCVLKEDGAAVLDVQKPCPWRLDFDLRVSIPLFLCLFFLSLYLVCLFAVCTCVCISVCLSISLSASFSFFLAFVSTWFHNQGFRPFLRIRVINPAKCRWISLKL